MLPREAEPGRCRVAWCVAIAGFVVYLASSDSFMDAYGGVSTGVVLLCG